MSTHIACDFAAAGRVTDVNRFLEVEMFGNGEKVVSVVIHIVSVGHL